MFRLFKSKQDKKIKALECKIEKIAQDDVKLLDFECCLIMLSSEWDIMEVMKSLKSVSSLPDGNRVFHVGRTRIEITVQNNNIVNFIVYENSF